MRTTGKPLGPSPSAAGTTPFHRRLASILPVLAFFLSGTSSLVFQNIWSRDLHRVFGATSVAVSTVVTVFMGGLGLGAFVAGRYADRIKHPLISYALIELLIGSWAFFVPNLLGTTGWLADVNRLLRVTLAAESLGLSLGRFAAVVPVLLVPTTLMGMTLPLLVRHFVLRAEQAEAASARVGMLYGVNTLGAVFGVALSAFVLLPTLGVRWTNFTALSINLLLGAGILLCRGPLVGEKNLRALSWWPQPSSDETAERAGKDAARRVSPLVRQVAFWTFAASGTAALCYEVVWTRALAMTIGSSVFGFAIILLTFLIGIAGGSAFASAIVGRRAERLTALGGVATLLVGCAVGPLWLTFDKTVAVTVFGLALSALVAIWFFSRPSRQRLRFSPRSKGALPELAMLVVPVAVAVVTFWWMEPPMLAGLVLWVVLSITAYGVALRVFRTSTVLMIATAQFLVGVSTFGSYLILDEIPLLFAHLAASVDHVPEHAGTIHGLMLLTAGICVLPSAVGMGAMFPLTIRAYTGGGTSIGRDVGRVYAGNTLGSLVGAWLPGFVLMPWIGMEQTLIGGIVLNLILALIMVVVSGVAGQKSATRGAGSDTRADAPEPPPSQGIPVAHAVAVYLLSPLIPSLIAVLLFASTSQGSGMLDLRWKRAQMTLGVFRLSYARDLKDQWSVPGASDHLLFYADGRSTTVSVEQTGAHIALRNNGKVDASNGGDMTTQIMVAAIPLLLHRQPMKKKTLAIIGFGSGVTVGTAIQFPTRRVDVIELERNIPKASRYFAEANHLSYPGCASVTNATCQWPFAQAPGLRVINDDGRNFLSATDTQYDVIISEPSNPWIAGVADLFSEEHFALSKSRLQPGGIYCQWVQLYELSPTSIKVIYRTFAAQFRHVIAFAAEAGSSDTILLGSDEPLTLDIPRMTALFDREPIRAELLRAEVTTPYDVMARILFAQRQDVLRYAQLEERNVGRRWEPVPSSANDDACPAESCRRRSVPLNTDDNGFIEFSAPRDLIGYAAHDGYDRTFHEATWPYAKLDRVATGFANGPEGAAQAAQLALALLAHGRELQAEQYLKESVALGGSDETRIASTVMQLLLSTEGEPLARVEPPTPSPSLTAPMEATLLDGFQRVKALVDSRQFSRALDTLEEIPRTLRESSGPSLIYLQGYLRYKSAGQADLSEWEIKDRMKKALSDLEALCDGHLSYCRAHPEIDYFLARALDAQGAYGRAVVTMRRFVEQLTVLRRPTDTRSARGVGTLPDDPG